LGIYINEKYLGKIGNYSANEFQWEIASLFHDIGYTAQFANLTYQRYFKYNNPSVSGAPSLFYLTISKCVIAALQCVI